MSLTNLKDDLLQEFREEREMIREQVEILDPLATSLRKPAAQRILSSSALILIEILTYLLSAGSIVFLFFMNKVYPFSLLSDIFYKSDARYRIGVMDLTRLTIAIYGLFVVCAILFLLIARACRSVRLKNDILNMAGKDIKIIVGQHLRRKAAIDTIEQRHMLGSLGSIEVPAKATSVPNPGYSDGRR